MPIKKFLYLLLSPAMVLYSTTTLAFHRVPLPNPRTIESRSLFVKSFSNESPSWPTNITAPADLIPFLEQMLKRSPSFRWQCYRLSLVSLMRITIVYTPAPPNHHDRAVSIVEKYSGGLIRVTVHLYPPHTRD